MSWNEQAHPDLRALNALGMHRDLGGCDKCRLEEDLKCLDQPRSDCRGPVEYRVTPDRRDGKAFPRCEHHFDLRLDEVERNLELMSPTPAAWFDPAYAGESWDEEPSPDPYWMND